MTLYMLCCVITFATVSCVNYNLYKEFQVYWKIDDLEKLSFM